jgi:hypothetical protein
MYSPLTNTRVSQWNWIMYSPLTNTRVSQWNWIMYSPLTNTHEYHCETESCTAHSLTRVSLWNCSGYWIFWHELCHTRTVSLYELRIGDLNLNVNCVRREDLLRAAYRWFELEHELSKISCISFHFRSTRGHVWSCTLVIRHLLRSPYVRFTWVYRPGIWRRMRPCVIIYLLVMRHWRVWRVDLSLVYCMLCGLGSCNLLSCASFAACHVAMASVGRRYSNRSMYVVRIMWCPCRSRHETLRQ